MRMFEFTTAENTHVVLSPPKGEDFPQVIKKVDLELRCEKPISAYFVLNDGQMVFIDAGTNVKYTGAAPADLNCIDVKVERDAVLAHYVFFEGPRRLFERTDSRPLVVTDQAPLDRPAMEVLRAALSELTPTQLRELQEDIEDDLEEDALPFEDGDPEDFGEGSMEPEPGLDEEADKEEDEGTEEKATAETAPSPEKGGGEASEDGEDGKKNERIDEAGKGTKEAGASSERKET